MIPVGDEGIVPIALGTYKMGIIETYIISVIGNMVPVVLILGYWSRFPNS
ncbi:MAG: small multi-drug export protein [Actinomycetota bacterium]|nr:small multi-drug export protein [Actinomycetota bacterium]